MPRKLNKTLSLFALISLFALAACDNISTTPVSTPSALAPTSTSAATSPTKVTIALGYIPDVQFAPFYLALNKGYYKAEGLDVTLQNGIVTDLITQLGSGQNGINFAVVSGDEVIPARIQGIPIKYVMTWYRQYPVAAVSINGQGPTLTSPADLKGHKIGVPGPYGSTYTGLLALLKAGNLTLNDIQLESIGFTQIPSLTAKQVDVAMVYSANEPIQLQSQGVGVTTLNVADYAQLASNGLVTNNQTLNDNPDLVAKVVRATLHGVQDSIADPEAAFQAALTQVPEAGGANKDLQFKILQQTIKLMQPNPNDKSARAVLPTLGLTEVSVWQSTEDFLFDAKIITQKPDINEMFTNQFVQLPPK
jgi:NitT/TauT family transport system substrate-binding protein